MLKCMHAFRPWCMHPIMNYGSRAWREGEDERFHEINPLADIEKAFICIHVLVFTSHFSSSFSFHFLRLRWSISFLHQLSKGTPSFNFPRFLWNSALQRYIDGYQDWCIFIWCSSPMTNSPGPATWWHEYFYLWENVLMILMGSCAHESSTDRVRCVSSTLWTTHYGPIYEHITRCDKSWETKLQVELAATPTRTFFERFYSHIDC